MGMPCVRMGDHHVCPMVTGTVPHVGGPVIGTAATVLVQNMPAATVGDMAVCVGPPDTTAACSPTVMMGGKPCIRLLDTTAHGGMPVVGCFTVLCG